MMQTSGFQSKTRMSLRQAKLKEFREKKKLLHPFERDQLISGASELEQVRLKKQIAMTCGCDGEP